MKHLITTLTLVFTSIVLFAQIDMNQNKSRDFNQQRCFFERDMNNLYGKNLLSQKQDFTGTNNHKGTIWVLDSTYLYDNGDETEWILEERQNKVLSRDEHGNMTNAISHFYDAITETWSNKDTITTTYHNNDTLHKYLRNPWNSTLQQWSDTSYFLEYDEDGNLLISFIREWSYTNNYFTFGYKTYSIYTNTGDIVYDNYYGWDFDNQEWDLFYRNNYTYDDSGNIIQVFIQSWNNETEEWENYSLKIYTYDDNGNQTQSIRQNWNNDIEEWKNFRQFSYTYDNNGNLSYYLYQSWNGDGEVWENEYHYSYTYNGYGNLTLKIRQDWVNDTLQWHNSVQYLYSYDINGNQIYYLSQTWDGYIEDWKNSNQSFYTYDDNGNRTQELFQIWDINSEEWINNYKYDHFWSEFETNGIKEKNKNKINITPNPASDKITILSGITQLNPQIKIYSISGILVQTGGLNFQNEIDISNLAKGFYFLIIDTDKGEIVRKFIKD